MLIPFCFEISQVVWFFTCFGVILLGVDVGLGVGVICALFAVVLSLSRYVDFFPFPYFHLFSVGSGQL